MSERELGRTGPDGTSLPVVLGVGPVPSLTETGRDPGVERETDDQHCERFTRPPRVDRHQRFRKGVGFRG